MRSIAAARYLRRVDEWVGLPVFNTSRTAPDQERPGIRREAVTGAGIATLVVLGYPVIAMRTLEAALTENAVDMASAAWVIDQFLLGNRPAAPMGQQSRRSNASPARAIETRPGGVVTHVNSA